MNRALTPVHKLKINQGIRIIKSTTDADCLFQVVVVVGPTIFGSIFMSNSNTVWARIEKPAHFRYEEIKKLSEAFEITICKFFELIEMQAAHNRAALLKNSPIGRKKYNPTL